jgi:O-antigen ligase
MMPSTTWRPASKKRIVDPVRPRPLSKASFGFLWLFVFCVPWENMSLVPGLGTIGRLVGMAAFGVGILGTLDSGRVTKMTAPQMLMAAFCWWRAMTYLWTLDSAETVREIGTTLQLIGMVWLLNQYAQGATRQASLLQAFVLGTCVSAIGTIYAYVSGTFADQQYLRYAPSGFNPGDLALVLVLSLPMSVYLILQPQHSVLALVNRVHLILTGIAILLTAARGALIAVLATLVMAPFAVKRMSPKQMLLMFLVGAIGAGVMMSTVPDTSWERLSSIMDEVKYGNLNERVDIWKAGIDLFRTRPFIGVGAGAYLTGVKSILGVGWVAHNTFLSVLVEEGAIGFVFFGLILWTLIATILRHTALEKRLWLALLLAWAVGVMDLSWDSRKPTWLLFGLISLQPLYASRGCGANAKRRQETLVDDTCLVQS